MSNIIHFKTTGPNVPTAMANIDLMAKGAGICDHVIQSIVFSYSRDRSTHMVTIHAVGLKPAPTALEEEV